MILMTNEDDKQPILPIKQKGTLKRSETTVSFPRLANTTLQAIPDQNSRNSELQKGLVRTTTFSQMRRQSKQSLGVTNFIAPPEKVKVTGPIDQIDDLKI